MSEKSMTTALIISFIFSGLGIAYAGNVEKGVIILAIVIILNVLGLWISSIFSHISTLVWIYGLYATYQEVKAVNGA